MKSFKQLIVTAAVMTAALASGSAPAYGGAYYGGHHGSRVGVYFGVPVLGFGSPYYGYPGYYGFPGYGYGYGYGGYGGYGVYAPRTVIVTAPAAPTVYVEQGTAAFSGPASDGNWYYCHNPDGYYPYVKQCAENWQRVPAQPASR